MAHEIKVVFHNGEPVRQVGLVQFRPKGQMRGEVILRPDRDITCNHLWVRLQWHTEGRGTRDSGEVARLDLFQGNLKGGIEHSFPFTFDLPSEPWSYVGHLIAIVWEVTVEVDIPRVSNMKHQQPFILSPFPPE